METTTPSPTLAPSKNGHHPQTGPKTPAGKARSKLNAVTHGIEATDEIFTAALKPRERSAFTRIRRTLRRYYQPRNESEMLVIDRIAIQHLRMFRLYQIESYSMYFLPVNKGKESILPHLDRLSRYDVRIERQIRILHNRLISMIQNRGQKNRNLIPDKE